MAPDTTEQIWMCCRLLHKESVILKHLLYHCPLFACSVLPSLTPSVSCSLQVHQVISISHQLLSYLHFAANTKKIQMACIKKT